MTLSHGAYKGYEFQRRMVATMQKQHRALITEGSHPTKTFSVDFDDYADFF